MACPAPAAEPPALGDYFRETWRTADGLPHNLVNDIAQTPDGYLWFATWEGLARFNGREFAVFDRQTLPQLSDAGVRTLHVNAAGDLWIGGSRGSLARLHAGRWQFFESAASLINDLYEDRDGRLWIAADHGLERLDADGRRHHYGVDEGLTPGGVYSLVEDAAGRLLVGTETALLQVEGERVVPVAAAAGLPRARIATLQRGAGDSVLIGTERGLYRMERGEAVPFAGVEAGESVTDIELGPDGRVWFGTFSHGLVRLSADGLERAGLDSGLPNDRVLALLTDRDGHMWVGTSGGLIRFRIAPFQSFTIADGLPDNYVRAVLERRDGRLLVGTSSGLARESSYGRFEVGDGAARLPHQSVLSLAEGPGDALWVGTYASGLLLWRDGRMQRHYLPADGLAGTEVRALLPQPGGGIWVGTANGLSHVDAGNRIRTLHVSDGLPDDFIVALHQAGDGRIWVGTATGLAWIDAEGVHRMPLPETSEAEFVFGFHEAADGTLWMATDRGLLRLRDGRISHVGRAQGLPFDKVFNVVADDRGNFWLGSNRGVLRIAIADAEAVADGERPQLLVDLYSEADGMLSAQCNGGSGPAALRRRDGSVWFATAVGVAAVAPQALDGIRSTDPSAVLERFRVDGVAWPLEDGQRLPAGTNRLELVYAGLGYVMPHRIQYQYRLEGFDRDWVDRGSQLSAEFTNLQPGDYRFRVRAAYPGGRWDGAEATLGFSVAPLLWQRPLFWWAGGILLLLFTVVAYKWRVRLLQQGQRRLRALVELRTSDLRLQTEKLQAADAEKTELLARLRAQSDAFARQAREDALTGLANRRAFDEALASEFARAERSGHSLCLALADIDHFKRINDDWSHAVGDDVLRRVADEIRGQCRAIDAVARWGGEEFAVLLPYTSIDEALLAGERLRDAVARMDCSDIASGLQVTISVGVAELQKQSHHEKLLSEADEALYRAKQGGRNRVST